MNFDKSNPVFETKHFIFRPLTLNEVEDLFEIYSDPDVIRLDYSEPVTTKEQMAAIITAANSNPSVVTWSGEHKSFNKVIGTCGFKNWNRQSRNAELGGNLAREFWNQGYAAEALGALINYGFENMNLNKVYASTNSRNIAALRLLNKFGFTQEGHFREHQFLDGEFADVFFFSLFKKDYNNAN
ncbi:GNAT family N-acetyltransferase [Evansella clarkii]|uniref:GNAT family N-acetyltransferase n=1 Tax=Evansella clarkii TaxID=79879 RepID=UPI000997E6F5|nr:GNAT family protein [Evansella clarkii]